MKYIEENYINKYDYSEGEVAINSSATLKLRAFSNNMLPGPGVFSFPPAKQSNGMHFLTVSNGTDRLSSTVPLP